jgi:endonuclease YncB( thermonuclease family)
MALFVFPNSVCAFEGKVVSVTDGDTINVLKDGKQVKIRLAAIDCPEIGQSYGDIAKQFTSDMAEYKVVRVRETGKDRDVFIVGFVFVNDINLNEEILAAGLAWTYKKYSRVPALAKLESEARSAKRGLWAEPNPVPPWEWRRKKRSSSL